MDSLASHRFTSSNNYLSRTLHVHSMAKPAKQLVLDQRRPGQARRGNAGELMQSRQCTGHANTRSWHRAVQMVVGTYSARNVQDVTAKYSSNPANFKDLIC
jgi:hypothetical protein